MNQIYHQFGISQEVLAFGSKIEESLAERFAQLDKIAEYNQMKVIAAMQKHRVSAECFNSSTGYGYNDLGRDTLEEVYATCFGGEAALVRPQITCGTHALALALMSNVRPGDEILSPVGKPYDTLEEVIGIRPSKGSLAEYGVTYAQVDLLADGGFDYEGIRQAINEHTHLVTIQRSKGLGENEADMMWETTMNPESRRLIRVMPEDAAATSEMFDLLLGENLSGRKEYIAENGWQYLEFADIS